MFAKCFGGQWSFFCLVIDLTKICIGWFVIACMVGGKQFLHVKYPYFPSCHQRSNGTRYLLTWNKVREVNSKCCILMEFQRTTSQWVLGWLLNNIIEQVIIYVCDAIELNEFYRKYLNGGTSQNRSTGVK